MCGVTHDTSNTLAPSAWVVRWAPLITHGAVLDLACGSGRHARLLAGRGHVVTAVDRDAGALAAIADVPLVHALRADLEDGGPWPFAGARFSAIVVTNYLHRPLFPAILDTLAPDGVLLYETFMLGNERFGKPSNPDFLLRAGELWSVFGASLEVRAYEQGLQRLPKAAMIQRLCALNTRFR